jgi:putative transcriptional regulator
MITHHPGEDLLVSYGAGGIGESWSLAVATHLALCPVCRRTVADLEDIGGVLLDDSSPEIMSAGALDRAFAALDAPAATMTTPPAATSATLPQPLRDYVGGDVDTVPWRSVGGGVRQHVITTSDKAWSRLLLIPPGRPVPEHGHRGRELTLVLSGSFTDQHGAYSRGDMGDVAEDTVHSPAAGPGENCVCLAITDAPIKFTALLPRLIQPFVRI